MVRWELALVPPAFLFAIFGNLPASVLGWHSDSTLFLAGMPIFGVRPGVSYRVDVHKCRKLFIPLFIAIVLLPGFCDTRWVAFGPDTTSQANAIQADRSNPQLMYLASERGIFVSHDAGTHWEPCNSGLHGYAVLTLEQAMNGTWVAGTNHGIFLLPPNANSWRPSNTVVNEQGTPRIIQVKGITRRVMSHHATRTVLQARINDIEIAPNRWLAATAAGIFSSSDQGKIWGGGPVGGEKEFIAIKAEKELVVAATRSKLFLSTDGGTVWKQMLIGAPKTTLHGLVILPDLRIFVASSDGVFRSADAGVHWDHLAKGIPSEEIGSITFDAGRNRLLAYSDESGMVFASSDRGKNWHGVGNAGPGVYSLTVVNGRLLAATAHGLLVRPDRPQTDSTEANRDHGNWFLRLVHRSE